MAMALVWNDAKSFKQHLEYMRMFRRSHHSVQPSRFAPLKGMPTSCGIHPPSKIGGARGFINVIGKSVLVPLWEIVLPRGSQN